MGIMKMTENQVELSGNLVRVFAPGGETTGFGLKSTIEIDLATNNLEDRFMEDANVTVMGDFEVVEGVETGKRQVFVVSKIEENR
ncbi:MAG: hypothetical protein QNJ46_07700 [Leptolyngbyaceae cyanobacterium MO_188.B28]|nr:hypothetical protein [Leptolyngbyaceae cyanobacterium MO_188.B28]